MIKRLIETMNKNKKSNMFDASCIMVVALLYLLNALLFKKQTTGCLNDFFICYFDDIICPVLFLPYCNILLRQRDIEIMGFYKVLFWCLIFGLVWEYIGPIINTKSISDPIDLLCYKLGGIIYWGLRKVKSYVENKKCI